MSTLGVTVGKFLPFHRGHDLLLTRAQQRVDHLAVVLGHRERDPVPGAVRAAWIREMHPAVEVLETPDDLPEAPEPWAARTLDLLGGRRPDRAFTSEGYGDAWAAAMGCVHEAVDVDRRAIPISGTALRADLAAHWDALTPPAKAWFARRVCVTGVESSGTTTLARALAEHYGTAWVPEYGRAYWEGRQHAAAPADWATWEFVKIAQGQLASEEDLARRANRVLICDTDALTTHVWHRRYVGHYADAVERIAAEKTYDLTVVTLPDFPFVQDGTREGAAIRLEMHDWLVDVLEAHGRPHVKVGGAPAARMEAAVTAIEPLLRFAPLGGP